MKQTCTYCNIDRENCFPESCRQFAQLIKTVESHGKQICQLKRAIRTKKLSKTGKKRWADGNTVVRFRKRYSFTQKEIAILLGVHTVTVSRWENGKIGMSTKTQKKILALRNKDEEAIRVELAAKVKKYNQD